MLARATNHAGSASAFTSAFFGALKDPDCGKPSRRRQSASFGGVGFAAAPRRQMTLKVHFNDRS